MSPVKNQKINFVLKRDRSIVDFNQDKVALAIEKALKATEEYVEGLPEELAKNVVTHLEKKNHDGSFVPSVEMVQDTVEIMLMRAGFFATAKAYIIYREERAQLRKRDVFKKRISFKPYEYHELIEYVDGIQHSYWLHTEFNYTSDIQDYKASVTDVERSALKNAMLAIAQVEVSVKTFWGNVYNHLPKPEIGAVGATFAESEVRHANAYAHLIEILGLNSEFDNIKSIPAIMSRIHYVEKALAHAGLASPAEYSKTLLLFSLFIEHVSLFSQFLIIMSFNKHKALFRGMSNVIEATSKEEALHGNFGIDLLKIIKEEHPEWFDQNYTDSIVALCKTAHEAEEAIIDWIFEKGELEFMPKATVKEFVKNRFNNSLQALGFEKLFPVDQDLLAETSWFDEELAVTKHVDFFSKRSVNYNKRSESITGSDLF